MERFPSSRCASAIQIVRPCASKAEQAAPTSSGFTEIVGDDSPLLVSLTLESLLKGFSHYVQSVLPGGIAVAMSVYLVFDFAIIVLLFAMIFKFLPDAKIQWRDVWIGAVMTAILFGIGKWRFVPGQRRCRVSLWSGQFSDYFVTLGLLFISNPAVRR